MDRDLTPRQLETNGRSGYNGAEGPPSMMVKREEEGRGGYNHPSKREEEGRGAYNHPSKREEEGRGGYN